MNNAIEITGLSKKYDGFKLENINTGKYKYSLAERIHNGIHR